MVIGLGQGDKRHAAPVGIAWEPLDCGGSPESTSFQSTPTGPQVKEARSPRRAVTASPGPSTLRGIAPQFAACAHLGENRIPIPVGRREEIFTAEDAEDAEKKTEGKREWIEIGRPSLDGSR
jgi:hypothetical protein